MKAVLAFAPPANPTYTPLGIATLTEYIRRKEPGVRIEPVDLNIATWHLLADASEQGRACRDFMQGRSGDFFDRLQYAVHQHVLGELASRLSASLEACRAYLEGGIPSRDLTDLLEWWAGLILRHAPDLIGISIMYPRQVMPSLALAKYLRELRKRQNGVDRRIVLGGATISALSSVEILQACPFVDAVMCGEGELALQMLCRGEPFEGIGGLSWRSRGGIVSNRKPDTLSLAEIPMPSFSDVNLAAHFNPSPVLPVIFSRGCLWRKCRFCAHNFSYSGYRRRAVDYFVDHLSSLADRGIRHFYFADQYVDAEDMSHLADELIARRLRIAYHIMGRPTGSYSADVCSRLYDAGCRWISWGIETGSQRLLDLCVKGTLVEHIEQAVRNAGEAGIANLLMMIFGLPTSCDVDLDATFGLLDNLADVTDDITCSSFQLWEKTGFAANPAAFGLQVSGREQFFNSPAGPVHSLQLFYREKSRDGTLRPPSGPLEIARWQRRNRITAVEPWLDGLPAEHALLYTERRASLRAARLPAIG